MLISDILPQLALGTVCNGTMSKKKKKKEKNEEEEEEEEGEEEEEEKKKKKKRGGKAKGEGRENVDFSHS